MNAVVVFYSITGNTSAVASVISEKLHCNSVQIEEVKKRKVGIGFATGAMGAILGLGSSIKPITTDMTSYDTIFLCTQVWAGNSVPAINSFLKNFNFQGKKVFLFVTLADDKFPSKVVNSISKKIKNKGGKVIDTMTLQSKMGQVIPTDIINPVIDNWIRKHELI